ncbi:hypothetical protein [Streptomyces sp. NPDC059176]|uniref:hypothetical protein n=1 Tax=unclassified Streptomyces TaxID=2593676 RepID=UPI0036858CFC
MTTRTTVAARPASVAVRTARAAVTTLALCVLPSCSLTDDAPSRYAQDYAEHEPLRVVGYPSSGSLQVVQQVVWRIADGDADALRALAGSDGTRSETQATAGAWIRHFRTGARGKVTADFYDEGGERQTVVLYFHGTSQRAAVDVRLDGVGGEDGWRVRMNAPDPARDLPDWVPAAPGALGSKTPA